MISVRPIPGGLSHRNSLAARMARDDAAVFHLMDTVARVGDEAIVSHEE